MLNYIDNYFFSLPEPEQSCLLYVRSFILGFSKDITEEWKFNTPFYYYKGKWLCYISYGKKNKSIYIGFIKGHLMQHAKLVSEGRKQIKVFHLNANDDIDVKSLKAIMTKVLKLYKI